MCLYKTAFLHWSLIEKKKHNRNDLLTRPGWLQAKIIRKMEDGGLSSSCGPPVNKRKIPPHQRHPPHAHVMRKNGSLQQMNSPNQRPSHTDVASDEQARLSQRSSSVEQGASSKPLIPASILNRNRKYVDISLGLFWGQFYVFVATLISNA